MKLRALALSLVMVLSVLVIGVSFGTGVAAAANEAGNVTASDLPGSGTSDDPYQISNASELQAIEDNLGANYTLVADVNASDTSEWNGGAGFAPIGDSSTPFTGTLDGNGHAIEDLYINRGSTDNVGLFAFSGGTVADVHLRNVNVSGGSWIGSLLGVNDGTVISSSATGKVGGTTYVGGLVGTNNQLVKTSSANVNVDADDKWAGGLVGENKYATVMQSYAMGEVVASEDYGGGLVGYNDGTVNTSYATGAVGPSRLMNDGGLIGEQTSNALLEESYWDMDTTSRIDAVGENGATYGGNVIDVTGLTTSEMQGKDPTKTMDLLDFSGTWATVESADHLASSDGYPTLQAFDRQRQLESQGVNTYTAIRDWNDLDDIRNALGGDYLLMNDLDENTAGYESVANASANGGQGFDPIGDSGTPFTGTFDGNGSTIANLTINRSSEDDIGLFGRSSGEITNVTIDAVTIDGSTSVGGLVGDNYGGTVTASSANGSVNGSSKVGGIVGSNRGTVTATTATVAVTGTDRVGGLVGAVSAGTVNTSSAAGTVTGSNKVGGLIGENYGTIAESYASGAVNSSTDYVGGLVAYNYGTVENSYATGDVNGSQYVAGLTGTNAGTVRTSYATGNVTGSADLGGLVGFNSGTVTDAYWDVNTTGQDTSDGGSGLTTSQLKANTSLAFDFTNTWAVKTGGEVSYPYLLNNTQSPAPGLESLFAGGDGTEASPYQIADWNDLDNVRNALGANYTLVADLYENSAGYSEVASPSANDDKGFDPIGPDYDTPFNGTFDGQGHTIANLTINRTTEDNVGLFGTAGTNAEITNTSLEDANVTGSDNVGTLVGANDGTVTNSFAAANLTGNNQVGGLVGVVSKGGTVNMSDATGTVIGDRSVGGLVGSTLAEVSEPPGNVYASSASSDVTGNRFVGGLVGGLAFGTVTESNSTGAVIGKTNVGGLVGVNQGGSISLSNASGTVAVRDGASSPTNFGGLVGWSLQGTVTQSTATGDVQANDATSVGGLVGYADATGTSDMVNGSYATGNVTGAESVGGLAGTVINATVNQTYATGAVSGDTEVGGLVGNATGANTEVSQSYAVGSVSATGTPVGGLVGTTQDSATVTDAYWETETTGVSGSDGGAGLTTSQMIGLDALNSGNMEAFESPPWETVSDGSPPAADADGYPILQALAAEPQIHTPSVESGTQNLYAGGSGNETDPYEIANWTHLDNVRENLGANFTLVADLDSTTEGYGEVHDAEKGFAPLGDSSTPFTGTFDGNDSTIADLTINRSGDNDIGLFGYAGDGAVITNVTLESVTVNGSAQVGALVGNMDEANVTGTTASGTVNGEHTMGGLIGVNNGFVSASNATVTVTGTGSMGGGGVGGLVGTNQNGGLIIRSQAHGNVTTERYGGGLVGSNANGTVNRSWATGTVTGNILVGGLVGYNHVGSVSSSHATGNVSADSIVGGLIGGNVDSVTASNASGAVTGKQRVGGLVGANGVQSQDTPGGTIETSTASGTVTVHESATGPTQFGGLVGQNYKGTVTTSNATGDVQAGDATDVGGLIGYNDVTQQSTIRETHAIGDVTGSSNVGGLVGTNIDDLVADSYATGNVTGSSNVGGLVGANGNASTFKKGGTIENTTASGTVILAGDSTNPENMGGLVGQSFQGTVTQSNATGDVNGGDATNVGGLVGYNDATELRTIRETYATGAVDGGQNVGGLVGTNKNDLVTESYAIGSVNGSASVGGLVGINTGSIAKVNNSYAAGSVTGDSAGGLVGTNGSGATVEDAYWDTQTTNQSSSAGNATGLTTSEMIGANALDSGNMDALKSPPWATVNESTTGADADGYPILDALDTDPQVLTPEVEEDTGGDNGRSPSSGTGGGTSSSPSDTTATVEYGDAGDITVNNPQAGGRVVLKGDDDGTEAALSGVDTIQVDRLSMDVETDRDFTLSVTTFETDLTPSVGVDGIDAATQKEVESAANSFESDTNTVSAGYVNVEHDLGPEELSGATFNFRIKQSYLDDLDVSPEDVTLYRRSDGEWNSQDTEYVDSNGTHYAFEGTAPGFSVFALGTERARLDITDPALDESTIETGESAQVTATVVNHGATDGTKTVNVSIDGTVVASETVDVAAGSSEHVSLEFEQDVGEWQLLIDGEAFDTLVVEQQGAETPTTTEQSLTDTPTTAGPDAGTTTTVVPDQEGDGLPVLGVLLVILLVAGGFAVFLLAGRREEPQDDESTDSDENAAVDEAEDADADNVDQG
ncbi:putative membrane protein [Halapricum desulfuricans]|uniref:Putative membrane protein n=1 Tax=Halapricum desulfuricans TaxID=2841257 RepID=A0A897NKZ7_9EURY|nr:GLUG motif-containing protein [Halapricum desulfuricans]QSG13348.1 putative membrane protein [Halapricum desulfuricans]